METIQKRNETVVSTPNIYQGKFVTFVIPTIDNFNMVNACASSILSNTFPLIFKIIIINNGVPHTLDQLNNSERDVKVIDAGSNLGWMGGINLGLKEVDTPFVCMLNDDTFVIPSDITWLNKLICCFKDPMVGAVAPCSNFVMQKQNMFWLNLPRKMYVSLLIGLCMIVRTDLLKKLGGLDESLPGGDDLDLSIRIEDAGYKLMCNRESFIFHHGQQTGKRLFGNHWDSEAHQDATNIAIIRKHGFKKFMRCRRADFEPIVPASGAKDIEGDIVRGFIKGSPILDVGCGANKTVADSIGIDAFGYGEKIESLGNTSHADVVSDVSDMNVKEGTIGCLISRHIFEHVIDPVKLLKEFDRVVRVGGRMIFALPDEEISMTIPLNPEHKHAYTKDSFKNLVVNVLPHLKHVKTLDSNNGVSFVSVYDK